MVRAQAQVSAAKRVSPCAASTSSCRRRVGILPPSRSSQRLSQHHDGILQVLGPQLRPNSAATDDFLFAARVVVFVTSSFVDVFVHLHKLGVQFLPLRSIQAFCRDRLTNCVPVFVHERWSPPTAPHIGGVDEGTKQSLPEGQFVPSSRTDLEKLLCLEQWRRAVTCK